MQSVEIDGMRSVLIVDDDVNILNMMETYLIDKNFVVHTVASGAEGLKNIMKRDYDIIICDLMMPSMSGDMFFRAVQRIKPGLCSRFIFITGFSMSMDIENFIKSCNAFCLAKPFTLDKLSKSIDTVFQRPLGT
ncbi:MAG: response regulator [Verrucomicrobiota bacterium]|nr:response regulator [Verrucomicrobiota bacterium]